MPDPGELVSIEQVQTYLDLPGGVHEDELRRLIAQATGVVQMHAGPTLIAGTFVDTVEVRGGRAVLPHWPILAPAPTATYLDFRGEPVAVTVHVLDASIGLVSVAGRRERVTVTYAAGLDEVPAEAEDAALVFIAYKYRRNHGGSESYLPAGVDAQVVTPMGTKTLADQLALALGEYARGPLV